MGGSKMFEGVNCKDSTPQPSTPKQVQKNVAALQKAMGMSEKCKKMQSKSMRNESASGGFSAGFAMVGFGGVGGGSASGSWQSSAAQLDTAARQEGCANMNMDTKNIMDCVRRMNCSITQNSAETDMVLDASASVKVVIEPIEGAWEKLLENQTKLVDQATKVAKFPPVLELIEKQLEMVGREILEFGEIKMEETVVKAKAGSKLRAVSQNVANVANKIEDDYKQVAKTVAENAIQQKSGPNAVGEQVKSLIDTTITKQSDTINSEIVQSISSTKVSVTQDGSIEIRAPNRIDLSGVTLDANVEVDLATSAVTSSSIELGKRIAAELMSEAASKAELIQESEGEPLADLVKAMNEGNAAAIKQQSDGLIGAIKAVNPFGGLTSGLLGPIILLVILVVGVGVMKKVMSGGGDEGGIGRRGYNNYDVKRGGSLSGKTMTGVRILVGLLVRLILVYSIITVFPTSWSQLFDILLPWRWGKVWSRIKIFIFSFVGFIIYCYTLGPGGHPALCLLKFWA